MQTLAIIAYTLQKLTLFSQVFADYFYGVDDGDALGLEGVLEVEDAAGVGGCYLGCAAALDGFYFSGADGDGYLWVGEGVCAACAAAHALVV